MAQFILPEKPEDEFTEADWAEAIDQDRPGGPLVFTNVGAEGVLVGEIPANKKRSAQRKILGYSIAATKNVHKYTAPNFQCGADDLLGGSYFTPGYLDSNVATRTDTYAPYLTGGKLNPSWGVNHIFTVDVTPIDKLGISLIYVMSQAFPYPANCNSGMNIQGYTDNSCAGGMAVAASQSSGISTDSQRVNQIFWLTVGYQVLDWLNISAALITATPQKAENNSLRQPFLSFDYNAFSTVSLGATVSIDKVAAKLF